MMRIGYKEKVILISIFTVIFFLNFTLAFAQSEYHATGTVIFADNTFSETISIGDPYQFLLFYPDNPTDIASEDSFLGVYPNSTISFNLNNIINATSTDCKIIISQNRTVMDPDSVLFSCENPSFNPGSIGDADFNTFAVLMEDTDGLALTSDMLPQNITALDSFWEVQTLILTYNATINTGEMEIPITVSILANFAFSEDTDGDGIIDFWEINGVDYDLDGDIDLDFPSLGADPMHKDLFLEIDYMSMHKPSNQTINDVIAAFAKASNSLVDNPDVSDGINLHIDLDESVSHQDNLVMWSGFDSIKTVNFGTFDERGDDSKIDAKKLFYRYAIFIHKMNGTGSSGRGELPGNDFVVSLGGFRTVDANGHRVGSEVQQTATLMHELGHTLDLHHGGDTDLNCKPNYLSIMSYTFQFPSLVPSRPLDYSREKLDGLAESNLSEAEGIGPGLSLFTQTVIGSDGTPGGNNRTSIGIPIDYNNNGNTTDNTMRDISNLKASCKSEGYQTYFGHSDWDKILYNFRSTAEFADGVHGGSADTIDEMTQEDLDEMIANTFPLLCYPGEGDWNITSSCELGLDSIAPANVFVQNNSVLTIPANVTLTIPSGGNMAIEFGSGVLIKNDGALQVNS